MKTIEIIVSATGQVHLQTKGFAGPACRQASRFLENALGIITADQPTPEIHLQADTQQHRHEHS
jgi:hypothetical protein